MIEDATNSGAADEDFVPATEVADEANALGEENQTVETDPNAEPTEEGEDNQDDGVEIEVDGQKYRVPKALEGAVLRQADYTRKTQELAQVRRTVEQEQQAIAQRREAQEALLSEHVRVEKLKSELEFLERVDFDVLTDQDPDRATALKFKLFEMRDQYREAKSELSAKEAKRLEEQDSLNAKALQETGEVLARDIPGWSPQLAGKLVETAAHYGLDHEELRKLPDPRLWKLLHEAYQWRSHQTKQQTGKRAQVAASTAPIKTVTSKAPPPSPLSDRADTKAWMEARNKQLRR